MIFDPKRITDLLESHNIINGKNAKFHIEDNKYAGFQKLIAYRFRIPDDLFGNIPVIDCMGIDPGVNFGVCTIHNGDLTLWGGALEKQSSMEKYAVLAHHVIRNMFVVSFLDDICIEAAAYGAHGKGIGLGYIRMGFYLGCQQEYQPSNLKLVAPNTMRKAVFGKGTTRAPDIWPTINPNLADALSFGIYSMLPEGMKHEQ